MFFVLTNTMYCSSKNDLVFAFSSYKKKKKMENNSTKNKGGRPLSEEHEKQEYRLVTYLDQTEKETYLIFKRNNIGSHSFHVKNALMQYVGSAPQKTKINKDAIRVIAELNKLAANINQISKHLNRGLILDGASTIEFLKNQRQAVRLITEIKDNITK